MIRDLNGTIEREGAEIGLFITLEGALQADAARGATPSNQSASWTTGTSSLAKLRSFVSSWLAPASWAAALIRTSAM